MKDWECKRKADLNNFCGAELCFKQCIVWTGGIKHTNNGSLLTHYLQSRVLEGDNPVAEVIEKPIAVPRMDAVLAAKLNYPRRVFDEMKIVELKTVLVKRMTAENLLIRITELVARRVEPQHSNLVVIGGEISNEKFVLGSPNRRLRYASHLGRLFPKLDCWRNAHKSPNE